MIKQAFSYLLVTLLLTTSCKTSDRANQPDSATLADDSACTKPASVTYAPKTSDTSDLVPDTTVSLGVGDYLNIEVKPEDFKNLVGMSCNKDGTCQSELIKPVKVGVGVPVGLVSKIKLTYEQSNTDKPGVCFRKTDAGATLSTPSCIGKILNVSLNIGVGIKRTTDHNANSVSYNAEPYCNANFSCNLPFLSASAKLDSEGLTFSSATGGSAGLGAGLVKVGASAAPKKSFTLPFPKWPDTIKKLKEYFTKKSSGAALTSGNVPDLTWDGLAITCPIPAT